MHKALIDEIFKRINNFLLHLLRFIICITDIGIKEWMKRVIEADYIICVNILDYNPIFPKISYLGVSNLNISRDRIFPIDYFS